MTMMHELAHNKQMNHSAAFHRVRIGFQNELKELWKKGYSGDGLWGRGVLLENGAFTRNEVGDGDLLPENLCGGTFKSGGRRKRKLKPKITYKERQERRIKKKFGTNGMALGADEETKQKLEKGKKPAGKPRVAGSARGRELRAAAALVRFETKKEEPEPKDEDLVTDSETESDEESVSIKTEPKDAVDIDGSRLLDKNGLPLFKVCEEEDTDDEHTANELLELQFFGGEAAQSSQLSKGLAKFRPSTSQSFKPIQPLKKPKNESRPVQDGGMKEAKVTTKPPASLAKASCSVCSMENESTTLTCMACSNVLKPDFVPNSWRCNSSSCKGSEYINAGDVGLCGVCDARKCSEGI
jgi:DNA-dependent metalloprotease WSS1